MKKRIILISLLLTASTICSGFGSPPSEPSTPDIKIQEKPTVIFTKSQLKIASPSTNQKVKNPYLFPPDTYFVDEISDELHDYFDVLNPNTNLITMKNNIKIKGINRFLTPTFVNGVEVRIRDDGRFYYDLKLDDFGENNLFITFSTHYHQLHTLRKKIMYLKAPPNFEAIKEDRKKITMAYNLNLFPNPAFERLVTENFTRSDLAFFITTLKNMPTLNEQIAPFSDVEAKSMESRYISYVIDNQFMSEFPDGTFRPTERVTKIEYILTLLKVLAIKPNSNKTPIHYKDVNKDWTTKYIRAALDYKLIDEGPYLNAEEGLTISSFLKLAMLIPSIKKQINDMETFSSGYDIDKPEKIFDTLLSFIKKRKEESKGKTIVKLNHPTNNQVILGDSVTFHGQIMPPSEITINQFRIVPNLEGKFYQDLPLFPGENTFTIKTEASETTYQIISLIPYFDLKHHWLNDTTAKLRSLSYLDADSNFDPSKIITKKELSQFLTRFFNLASTADTNKTISDVASPDSDIQKILANNILTLTKEGHFYPDKFVTRASVLIVNVFSPGKSGRS